MGICGKGWIARVISAAGVTGLVVAGCAGSAGTVSPGRTWAAPGTGLMPAATTSGAAYAEPTPRNWPAALVVLGTGAAGDRGIWGSTASGGWALLVAAPDATAVAGFGDAVALAGPGYVKAVRLGGAPLTTPMPLDWTAAGAGARVAAMARGPDGRVAVVTSEADELRFLVAGPDGILRPLEPTPSQSFAPSVAWLDDDRLLLLATDGSGGSKLQEIDVAAGSFGRTGSTTGLRDFALSDDSSTVAAVTARSILAGDPDGFLGGSPQVVGAIPDGEVAWGLAPDRTGSALALVEAAIADDGTAVRPHLVVFRRAAGRWLLQGDESLPLTAIAGLAWVPRP